MVPWFHRVAEQTSSALGSSWMFIASLVMCGIWIAVGPVFRWGELWHLIPTSILTWTTWVAALAIQHTQLLQEAALQRKLDEVIRAMDKADNRLIGIEKEPPACLPEP